MTTPSVKVGIVGGTGYTGVELLRLLVNHPHAEIAAITSRGEAGTPVAELFPSLRGHSELVFETPEVKILAGCDLVFFATPHNVAMGMVPELLDAGVRVVDLSADFRLRDAELWSRWYGEPHKCPELLAEVVYGLPEVHRDAIASARLVACPGCYPTAIQLGFLPLLENGLVAPEGLIASAGSGASGAGRQARTGLLLAETGESFKAYGASGHRHLPEIEQGLAEMADRDVSLTFVPHLVPMVRGIHATLFATLRDGSLSLEALQQYYEQRFGAEPFVDVMPHGSHPETRFVRGSNHCRLALHRPAGRDTVVVLSVIDNLTRGASGQAVHNMNLMLGLPEEAGLREAALLP